MEKHVNHEEKKEMKEVSKEVAIKIVVSEKEKMNGKRSTSNRPRH